MSDTVRTILAVVFVVGLGGWGAFELGKKAWPTFKPMYFVHKDLEEAIPEGSASLHSSSKEITVTVSATFRVAKEPEHCHTIAETVRRVVLKHMPDAHNKPLIIQVVDLDTVFRRDPSGTRSFRYPSPNLVQKKRPKPSN